jgi:hypothetical protein
MKDRNNTLVLIGYLIVIVVGLSIPVIIFRVLSHHWIYHTNNTLPAPAHVFIDIVSPAVSDPENPLTVTKVLEYVVMFFSACATFSIYRYLVGKHKTKSVTSSIQDNEASQ